MNETFGTVLEELLDVAGKRTSLGWQLEVGLVGDTANMDERTTWQVLDELETLDDQIHNLKKQLRALR